MKNTSEIRAKRCDGTPRFDRVSDGGKENTSSCIFWPLKIFHQFIFSKDKSLRNIYVSLGLVNGAIGTVIVVNKGNAGIDSVVLKLQSDYEYSIKRMEYKFAIMNQIYITREQFPFRSKYQVRRFTFNQFWSFCH